MIRKIHLDFHTRPDVPGVGRGFDPEQFAATLAAAHVNMLATPGKCGFGNTYFATRLGQMHPHLEQPDMFPATVAACVKRGIRVQAYFTLGLDDVAAAKHPDWQQRYRDGKHAQWGSKHICFASPYVEQVVIPEALEMLDACPGLCGFWFDICLHCDGAFYSPFFEALARERLQSRADDASERWLLARRLVRERCRQIESAIRGRLPDAENFYNSLAVPGEPENLEVQPCHEVENPILFGTPEEMTANVRWLRNRGKPVLGLVSRFQGPWMDPGTLRTEDQMRFDAGRVVSLGSAVSTGDHRCLNGALDQETYRRIAAVYGTLAECEPWLEGATACREAILLTEVEQGSPRIVSGLPRATLHAARLLEELGIQFDVRTLGEELPDVPLLVWPAGQPSDAPAAQTIRKHAARGNALLGLDAAVFGLEDLFGVQKLSDRNERAASQVQDRAISACGHVRNPEAAGGRGPAGHFLRAGAEVNCAPFAHLISAPSPLVEPLPGTRVLADRFAAASAEPPMPANEPVGPFIVERGRAIYCAAPLVVEAMERGAPGPAELLSAILERLLPQRLVQHSAGSTVAAHLHRCRRGYALHLLHWALDRWGKSVNSARAFPPLGPISVQIRVPEKVQRVTVEPQGTPLPFDVDGDSCSFVLPEMRIWQLIGVSLQ